LTKVGTDHYRGRVPNNTPIPETTKAAMRNLQFGFFDDSGLPRESRILMFYSFDTEENLSRSGILHYHVAEQRFVGPRHDGELTAAALDFLSRAGRLQRAAD
jgi:hypothetical protein